MSGRPSTQLASSPRTHNVAVTRKTAKTGYMTTWVWPCRATKNSDITDSTKASRRTASGWRSVLMGAGGDGAADPLATLAVEVD